MTNLNSGHHHGIGEPCLDQQANSMRSRYQLKLCVSASSQLMAPSAKLFFQPSGRSCCPIGTAGFFLRVIHMVALLPNGRQVIGTALFTTRPVVSKDKNVLSAGS